jgi:hypothetical protein
MIFDVRHSIRTAVAVLALGAGALTACGGSAPADDGSAAATTASADSKDSVSSHLGGYAGILAFLEGAVVPAELADPEIAAFFGNLSEGPGDIEQCLAMLLDHDLGGASPHNGAVLADGHRCRSSMSDIHRGRNIPDTIIDKFIAIVGQEAQKAGVAPSDIQAVAKALDSYRGGVRNK